jgi:drug/metabolite transporter (DMT)-like permease
MAGLAASAIGWGLFAFALAFTPVSVARAIQGSGFVVLALFSLLFLGHKLTMREWAGVALVTSGIVALGIADSHSQSIQSAVSLGRLLPSLAACLLACVAASAVPALLRIRVPWVIVFSVVAGTLLGLGDAATKVLLTALQGTGFGFLAGGAGAGLILLYVSGFLVLSKAYQLGRAILVTAVSDLCSRLTAIFIGMSALGEKLSGDPRLRMIAAAGYAAIIVGAVFLSRFSGEGIADGLAKPRAVPSEGGSQILEKPHEGKRPAPSEINAKE